MTTHGVSIQDLALSSAGPSQPFRTDRAPQSSVDHPIVLEALDVSKAFAGVAALHNVNFDLRSGEVHALMGENGAGKSTLMKILAGVHVDYEGEIRIEDELGDPFAVPQVDEDAAAVVAVAGHPAEEDDLVPLVGCAEGGGVVRSFQLVDEPGQGDLAREKSRWGVEGSRRGRCPPILMGRRSRRRPERRSGPSRSSR